MLQLPIDNMSDDQMGVQYLMKMPQEIVEAWAHSSCMSHVPSGWFRMQCNRLERYCEGW